jgi:methionyl-tRNA formyltransferase
MNIGLLVSGKLGLIAIKIIKDSSNNLSFVMTDRNSESIVEFCTACKIPLFVGNPRNNNAILFISDKKCDILLSVNYLFLIKRNIIDLPKEYAINIHGSLLPKYRGRTPHVWAIINNERYTGITAHIISEKCDAGDIIFQEKIIIKKNDTGNDILKKYEKLYPQIITRIICSVKNKTIKLKKQNEKLASYFPKRTPEDGFINWDWQKERIFNWVRALSYPYPGSFTFYKGRKIIINKVQFSDLGFNSELPNGTILFMDKKYIFVKVPNGVIKILEYSCDNITFEIYTKFDINEYC